MIVQIIGYIAIVFSIISFIAGARMYMMGERTGAQLSELFVCLYLIAAAICFK